MKNIRLSFLRVNRLVLIASLALGIAPAALCQASGTRFSADAATYTRAVRLQDSSILASMNGVDNSHSVNGALFYRSTDGGASFQFLSSFSDPDAAGGQCCGTLYVLPQNAGGFNAGTVLYATSLNYNNGSAEIKVYYSTSGGASWTYHSTPASGGDATHGVWEPQFEVASDGALVLFWSDETDGAHSQKLIQARNYGGGWQDYQNTVASDIYADRPGMAVVSRTPSVFVLTFELCGPAACDVFYKTSADGWNWGAADNVGSRVQTPDGTHFRHAPTNYWTFNPQYPGYGALLVIAQVLVDNNGNATGGNGSTLLVNPAADLSAAFYTISSPVSVPDAYDNYCPNYSSSLLQSPDGYSLLETTSDYSNGQCVAYFGTGSLY